jgi:hypothetical protein
MAGLELDPRISSTRTHLAILQTTVAVRPVTFPEASRLTFSCHRVAWMDSNPLATGWCARQACLPNADGSLRAVVRDAACEAHAGRHEKCEMGIRGDIVHSGHGKSEITVSIARVAARPKPLGRFAQ